MCADHLGRRASWRVGACAPGCSCQAHLGLAREADILGHVLAAGNIACFFFSHLKGISKQDRKLAQMVKMLTAAKPSKPCLLPDTQWGKERTNFHL